ncbi:hypothetical protein [Streptomyces javensis]|uniref:Uncharacterized protein n=1 Tax=Streptomyces javensis TaxID=114698 RepID=A0ABS0R5R9_9ACTN|nr:hypothetical protein [Streptomyces javensis]MBI0312737.1 hypothetical protein [Streptomyces javensis]
MSLLIAALVGAVAATIGRIVYRHRNPEPTCAWCETVSGWQVTGHDTTVCRGYVTEKRRRDATFGGELWRDPEDY